MPAPNPIKHCPGCDDAIVRQNIPPELQCTPCRKKERHRIWREANPGANEANAKRWREAGNKTVRSAEYKEAHRIKMRERYRNNPTVQAKAKERAAIVRKVNPEKVKEAAQRYQSEHKEELKEYRKTWVRQKRQAMQIKKQEEFDTLGRLGESSLGNFLREFLDQDIIQNSRVPGFAEAFRPDFRSEKHKLIVEFDGDRHYRTAMVVLGDIKRDNIFRAAGYKVIRIPYFIQLHKNIIDVLFGDMISGAFNSSNFPHGFVSENTVFPAEFCEIGVDRFMDDMNRFPMAREAVFTSLSASIEKKGDWRLVCPKRIHDALTHP